MKSVNQNLKLARSMMSEDDIKKHVPVFQTSAWEARKNRIVRNVKKQQDAAHAKAVLRKESAKPKSQTKAELKKAREVMKKVEEKKRRHLKFLTKKQKNA